MKKFILFTVLLLISSVKAYSNVYSYSNDSDFQREVDISKLFYLYPFMIPILVIIFGNKIRPKNRHEFKDDMTNLVIMWFCFVFFSILWIADTILVFREITLGLFGSFVIETAVGIIVGVCVNKYANKQ